MGPAPVRKPRAALADCRKMLLALRQTVLSAAIDEQGAMGSSCPPLPPAADQVGDSRPGPQG